MLADEDFHYLIITVKKQTKDTSSFPIHGLIPALKVVLISWKTHQSRIYFSEHWLPLSDPFPKKKGRCEFNATLTKCNS